MDLLNPTRVVELKIPSELGFEKIAREAVATVAKRLAFSDERVEDIKLAVSEACTNAISYGSNGNSQAKIVIVLTVDEDKLGITIKDPGYGGTPPKDFSEPDIHKMINGEARYGGMGLFIIQELMDSAEFLPGDTEAGNQFHMVVFRTTDDQ